MGGISIITALPTFVTQEQHRELTSSTPASFAHLPTSVLYHLQQPASITLEPPIEGFTASDCSNGTLYILSSVLVYMGPEGKGLSITYPTISLHAISRQEELGPSIYCQLDETISMEEEPTPDEQDALELRELRILTTESSLEPMFEALSQCAALHPDKDDEEDDEGDFDDAFLDENDLEGGGGGPGVNGQQELSEAGRVRSDSSNNTRFAPY
ncbi:hypothetical protein CPB86DRAFT_787487 [Serendipita vermifera]|nr:hypothetical protein CPB86DRAFT_787487 [Serendipita vermifera]